MQIVALAGRITTEAAMPKKALRTLYIELKRLSLVAQEPLATVGAMLRRIEAKATGRGIEG